MKFKHKSLATGSSSVTIFLFLQAFVDQHLELGLILQPPLLGKGLCSGNIVWIKSNGCSGNASLAGSRSLAKRTSRRSLFKLIG